MHDIVLYGHLTKDIIFDGFHQSYGIGSMANVWAALKDINPLFNIRMQPTAIGEAVVYVDKASGIRISKPKLNLHTAIPKLVPSVWNHILYINNLPDVSFVPKLNGIVSFDLSVGKPPDLDILKYADYLFLSDEEEFMDFNEMCKMVKGWVILHKSEGSIVSNGKETKIFCAETIKNINVLGAGDIFTANVIAEILKGTDIYDSVSHAHKETYINLSKRKS
jgi:hypothetical protein